MFSYLPIAFPLFFSGLSLEIVERSRTPVGRRVGEGAVRGAGGRPAEPHSMDRRLHDVVRGDVVVPGQRQTRSLHCDPETYTNIMRLSNIYSCNIYMHLDINNHRVMESETQGMWSIGRDKL